MTDCHWKLVIDPEDLKELSHIQLMEALNCISESIEMFKDFDGMCSV